MVKPTTTAEIIKYYTSSQWLYRYFWSPRAYGMHVGFWDTSTKNVDEAVENENKYLLDLSSITDTSIVLDAGCGVGSMSLYLGTHTHAKVVGITLVSEQVEQATKYAKAAHVYPRVSFEVADYTRMPYPDNTFDVIFGIESICYAYPKESFLKEARRVLKPGGRLIVADGYMSHPPKTAREHVLHDDFCVSFALSELIDVNGMERAIKKSGFAKIHRIDKTRDVRQGTISLYKKSHTLQRAIPFVSILPFEKARAVVRNAKAAQASMGLLSEGSGWYGVFVGIK